MPDAGNDTAYDEDRLRFSFPPDSEHVATARSLAASLARQHALGDEVIEHVQLLVSEAVTNAIRAHQERGVDSPITMVCTIDDRGFGLEVADAGGGLDAAPTADLPDIDALDAVGALDGGGFGIPIMHRLSTNARFVGNDSGGTTVTLRVRTD